MASEAAPSISPRNQDNSSTVNISLRARAPLVILALLLLGAVLFPDRVWNALLIGFGGLFLVSYFWVWQMANGLRAQRHLRFGWVAVGDRLSEHFSVENRSDFPAIWLEIRDQSTVPGYQPAIVRSVDARQSDHWRASAVCLRRGRFRLGPWLIRTSDPFGLFTMTRTYSQSEEIIIHPPIHGQLPIPLPLGESSGRVRARRRSWQATVNAASVREHRPLDPLNRIHWPSSARRGELQVREFDLDASGDIWLLLDLEASVQLGTGPQGTEEHAVLLAASLAARAIANNRAVGLATYGREPQILTPGRGQGQQWNILRALALVQADGQTPLEVAMRDLSRVAQKGAAAVVITPNGSEAWLPELVTLAQAGVHSHVTILDRPSFGGAGSSEGLSSSVRQLGFTASIIEQGAVGEPLHEQERRGFWEFKVTGFGKAVATRRPR